jgi:type IV secretion system protein VirB6
MPRGTGIAPASAGLAPRRVDVAPVQAAIAANDTGGDGGGVRETRVYATGAAAAGGGQVSPLNPATSRTRGIGNRFRSATATAPAAPASAPAPKTPPPETYR